MEEMVVALDTMWLLLAAFLVFFMQAGFALLEAGATRSKNAVNILMKNLMDFCIAALTFWMIGWGFAYGASAGGFIGIDQFFLGYDATEAGGVPILASWLFQVVFAGTAATIVSGAMAERTKFSSYLIVSAVMAVLIYPVVVHWVWSGAGWLTDLGFTDFAGSTVVHSVGGWAALMGAIVLGARIGRFSKDGKSQPIPGHNVSLVGLGVFILWLGWFGFNPGSQLALSSQADANAVALVAVNTTLAAAAAAVATVILTWIRTGKPDAALTLNSVIGGLVAITAACAFVTPVGAVIIGLVAGPLLVFSTSWLESLKIDDPVGAVPAHLVNGVWGTLALGLFAAIEGNTGTLGLFYGGGMALLIAQAIGVVAVGVWTVVLSGALFYGIKATIGLRVSKEEEELGLDLGEHGMAAYPDFIPTPTPGMAPPAPPSGGVSRAPAK
ncbi:ammonium transporter [Candidatus Chloroploca sp. M-50]|uniref:Ammonium transporter n=1 Tax=Candidatus Chloroploca mongolica TaxID=2528176 RepID=A0ABS4D5J6_9CHLR|nr:ammonium transporter [Candidatus Chloroploca mongolica]MBP1464712.1 ammonium transporter [Candidatus Chloroploca mongolica]